MKLFTMNICLAKCSCHGSAEFIKYFKVSSLSPQVVFPSPDGLLSREVPSTAVIAVNEEVMASCNSHINCKWVVCISFFVSISSCTRDHHSYICGIPLRTNETKSPGLSIVRLLPLCDEVVLR